MEKSMSHELKALADQLCNDDFRCLSQGIGVIIRSKKASDIEVKPSGALSSSDKDELVNKQMEIPAEAQQRPVANQAHQVALQGHGFGSRHLQHKTSSKISRLIRLFKVLSKKLLTWTLDAGVVLFSVALVVLTYSFSKGAFDLGQKLWLTHFLARVFKQFSFVFLSFGFFALLFMYGMLFRLIVGATLGEAFISRFLVHAKSQKNKRLYNNFI